MSATPFRRLAALLIAASALLLFGAPAVAQNPHAKAFGDWRVRCNPTTGVPTDCQIFQNVVVKETGQPVLQAVVGYMKEVKAPVGVLVLPLGVYLPSGLTLRIDQGETYEMAIEVCGRKGCRVRFSFDDKLLGTFKAGNVAEVAFYSASRQPIRVPLSLQGFTAAIGQLR